MKCKYLSLSLFALLASLFTAFFITNGDSFAVSDRIIVIDSNSSYDLCRGDCNDFNYIVFESNVSTMTSADSFSLNFYSGRLASFMIPFMGFNQPKIVFDIVPNTSYITTSTSYALSTVIDAGFSYTITLTSNSPFGIVISGSLSITENGTYDVTNYAEAVVDVPPEIIQGDYHDDLQELKQAAILIPAVFLLIYFFWAIYKMIMGGVRR